MKIRLTNDKWQVARTPLGAARDRSCRLSPVTCRSTAAFTLLEVMIAIGIFFVATFAILDLVSQNLRAAASLNRLGPTAGMVAAELSLTNQLSEGSESGDFGELYPDFSWMRDIRIYGTNGMYQVDIAVLKKHDIYSRQTILLFRPDSQGSMRRGG